MAEIENNHVVVTALDNEVLASSVRARQGAEL
jgi:hypothetical protein